MRRFVYVFVLLLFAAPASAAHVEGTWSGSLDTPQGGVEIAFTFVEDGAVLTGTSTGPDGAATALTNGTIDGNNIAFDVDIDMGGQAMTLAYSGEVTGDEIAMTIEIMGMSLAVTLTRTE
mgnify:CR=1 FL=1